MNTADLILHFADKYIAEREKKHHATTTIRAVPTNAKRKKDKD